MSANVVKTETQETVSIPEQTHSIDGIENIKTYLNEIQQRFIELISEKFNIPIEETMKFKIDDIEMFIQEHMNSKSKKNKKETKQKIKKITIDEWDTANTISELKSLTVGSLKDILSEKGLSITGSKSILIDRVWKINHPDYVNKLGEKSSKSKKKKKSKKQDETSSHFVEDSDDETTSQEDISDLLDNHSKTVYLNPENFKISDEITEGSYECIFITKKNWVFKNSDETLEYIGIYNGEFVVEGNPPPEILATMSEE